MIKPNMREKILEVILESLQANSPFDNSEETSTGEIIYHDFTNWVKITSIEENASIIIEGIDKNGEETFAHFEEPYLDEFLSLRKEK